MMSKLTRRKFLTTSAAMLGTGVAATVLPRMRTVARAAPLRTGTLVDVQHVIIFMNENRSFDHYFGTLSGSRGFSDPNAARLPNGKPIFYQPSSQNADGYQLPFHLDTSKTNAQCVADENHSWKAQHKSWNGGKMDDWIAAENALTMGYYTRADLPFQYALADAFTICDAYHCSVFGPTDPNRLYLWTGTIDPNGTGGGPVIANSGGPFQWTTYPERLEKAGISWRIYQQADNFGDNALAWFVQYQNAPKSSSLYKNGLAARSATAFQEDVAGGTLPAVSWIIAPITESEHPPFTPAAGANFVRGYLQALADHPDVWQSTVFLYCYDENDGFFDHVVPPTPPTGTPDEFISGEPIGLGFRVPMIVISPFSRGGWVCSDVFDHTSIIRFLEKRFGVYEPNISAWRRSVCGDLTSAFDFSSPDDSSPTLLTTESAVTTANNECEILPVPTSPLSQSMPSQEPGTRPHRTNLKVAT